MSPVVKETQFVAPQASVKLKKIQEPHANTHSFPAVLKCPFTGVVSYRDL